MSHRARPTRRKKIRPVSKRPKYVRVGKATFIPFSGFKMIDLLSDNNILALWEHRKGLPA